ncbi:MAG: PP0621 family protein [Pseudomonadota bacterium]
MLVRLLLLAAVAAVAWYLYRRLTARPAGQPPAAPQARISPCAECGVHAPENTGVHFRDHFFCSPEHLQSWLKKNNPG